VALDNTDAAADLAVGGLYAVRAFPQGEATGDLGYFVQAELRRSVLFDGLTAGLFVDQGHVEINADALPGQGSNNRSLAAAGLALRFQGPQLSSELILAERLDGGEPRSDNRDPRPRLWFSLSYRF
jgi:hemolysin activation/secretion protein